MDYSKLGLMTEEEVRANSKFNFYEEVSLDATAQNTGKKTAATGLALAPAFAAAVPVTAAATV